MEALLQVIGMVGAIIGPMGAMLFVYAWLS